MFVNYVALMLVNMTAGLVVLAAYIHYGLDDADPSRWAAAWGVSGLLALILGLALIWTWPLPGSYNIAFGEPSVLLGALLLGAAFALAHRWDLLPVTLLALIAGLYAMIIGIRIMSLDMTRMPVLSGIGYIMTGLVGVPSPPLWLQRGHRTWRVVAALYVLLVAAIWGVTALSAIWGHLADYGSWVPATLR